MFLSSPRFLFWKGFSWWIWTRFEECYCLV